MELACSLELEFHVSFSTPYAYFPLGSIEPPRFIKKLEPSRIVKQDEHTRYECKIGGSPEIKVLWYKDETEIQESNKFRMSFVESVAVLEMYNLNVEDSGDYTCEARNAAGSASSSTSLKVKGQSCFYLGVGCFYFGFVCLSSFHCFHTLPGFLVMF